jgi:hypothetical protein
MADRLQCGYGRGMLERKFVQGNPSLAHRCYYSAPCALGLCAVLLSVSRQLRLLVISNPLSLTPQCFASVYMPRAGVRVGGGDSVSRGFSSLEP